MNWESKTWKVTDSEGKTHKVKADFIGHADTGHISFWVRSNGREMVASFYHPVAVVQEEDSDPLVKQL